MTGGTIDLSSSQQGMGPLSSPISPVVDEDVRDSERMHEQPLPLAGKNLKRYSGGFLNTHSKAGDQNSLGICFHNTIFFKFTYKMDLGVSK